MLVTCPSMHFDVTLLQPHFEFQRLSLPTRGVPHSRAQRWVLQSGAGDVVVLIDVFVVVVSVAEVVVAEVTVVDVEVAVVAVSVVVVPVLVVMVAVVDVSVTVVVNVRVVDVSVVVVVVTVVEGSSVVVVNTCSRQPGPRYASSGQSVWPVLVHVLFTPALSHPHSAAKHVLPSLSNTRQGTCG